VPKFGLGDVVIYVHYTWAMATQPLVRRPELAWKAGESGAWLVGRQDAAKQRVGGVWCQGPVCRAGRASSLLAFLAHPPILHSMPPKGATNVRAPAVLLLGGVDNDARTNQGRRGEKRRGQPSRKKDILSITTHARTKEEQSKVPLEETRCFMPRPLFQSSCSLAHAARRPGVVCCWVGWDLKFGGLSSFFFFFFASTFPLSKARKCSSLKTITPTLSYSKYQVKWRGRMSCCSAVSRSGRGRGCSREGRRLPHQIGGLSDKPTLLVP